MRLYQIKFPKCMMYIMFLQYLLYNNILLDMRDRVSLKQLFAHYLLHGNPAVVCKYISFLS